MQNKLAWIKYICSLLLLFLSSFLVSLQVVNYAQKKDYFNISIQFSINIVISLLVTLFLYALVLSITTKFWQNLSVSLIIAVSLSFPLFKINTTYTLIVLLLSALILVYNNDRTIWIKEKLISFNPRLILKFSAKGLILVFSAFAAVLIMLDNSNVSKINIGQKVAQYAEKPLKSAVEQQLNQQIQNQFIPLEENNVDTQSIWKNLGISPSIISSVINTESIDLNGLVEKQINQFLEPYKNFIAPFIALLIFGLFQFYGNIAYAFFSLLITALFKITVKTKLLKIEKETVEKENLSF